MNAALIRFICRILAVCLVGLPLRASADLVGTAEVVDAAQAQATRAALASFAGRADVARQLQALGVSPLEAQARIAALTDAEVAVLADQAGGLPAGASGGAPIVVLAIILFLLWTLWKTS